MAELTEAQLTRLLELCQQLHDYGQEAREDEFLDGRTVRDEVQTYAKQIKAILEESV